MGLCNGPFDCMGRILRKILEEKADVALVYPLWPRSWQGVLQQLRDLKVVRKEWRLRRPQGKLFQKGARVPDRPGRGDQGPHYQVWCAIIAWDQPTARPCHPPRG
jgi:hypothetical protein